MLPGLLWLKEEQARELVEGDNPWAAVLRRISDRSTTNDIWVPGLLGEVAALIELARQAKDNHNPEFVVADPCIPTETNEAEGPKVGFAPESVGRALSSVGVQLRHVEPLVLAQRLLSG